MVMGSSISPTVTPTKVIMLKESLMVLESIIGPMEPPTRENLWPACEKVKAHGSVKMEIAMLDILVAIAKMEEESITG